MPRTILVVDDYPSVRETIRQLLIDQGYQVRCADDSLAALREVKAAVPDLLVLSDVRMPRLDGVALAECVARRAVPILIILMSADARTHQGHHPPVLSKIIDLHELLALVECALPEPAE